MGKFGRSCLFHATFPMRIMEEDQEETYKQLLASGEWFDHPAKVKRRVENEQVYEHAKKRNRQRKSDAS